MQEKPEQQSASTNTPDRGSSKQHQIAAAINSLEGSYKAGETQRGQHERETLIWARRAARAAILYTLLTSLLLAAGIYSAIQAWRAVDAASRAADIAARQAAIAQDTEKRQLRAYVFVDDYGITGIDNIIGPVTTVRIKNSGQTPAYQLRHGMGYTGPIPVNTEVPFTHLMLSRGSDQASQSELGPGGIHSKINQRRPITPVEINGLRSGTLVIYLFGEVRYTDAFGCDRWIRYKFVVGGPAADHFPEAAIAAEGNDTSDETSQDCLVREEDHGDPSGPP